METGAGAIVGALVGAMSGADVGTTGCVVGAVVAGTSVGESSAVGAVVDKVSGVNCGVLEGAGVGDGALVAVGGGFVATAITTRVVGEGGGVVGAGVCESHAATITIRMKKKSERMPFA